MKIKVLLVSPNQEVQVVRIPASLKFIKSFIGKELFKMQLNDNTVLIANKDADINEFNRIIGENIILGTFLVVSVKKNTMVNMRKKDIQKYTNIFKLRKHKGKITRLKDEYLEDYYTNQKEMKQRDAEDTEMVSIAA